MREVAEHRNLVNIQGGKENQFLTNDIKNQAICKINPVSQTVPGATESEVLKTINKPLKKAPETVLSHS